jgi:hypothetical protein
MRALMFTPSAYGILGWALSGVLYLLRVLPWEQPDKLTLLVLALVLFAFAASLVWQMRQKSAPLSRIEFGRGYSAIEVIFHFVGFTGVALYARDMAAILGDFQIFVAAAVSASYAIRWVAADSTSIGTQLSYLSWIAAALSAARLVQHPRLSWRYPVLLLQLLGNLLFIDRTRPIWIGFCILLVAISAKGMPSRRAAMRAMLTIPGAAFAIFLLVGSWIGKIPDGNAYGSSALPPAAQNVSMYLTSGFAYLNRMLTWPEPVDYRPVRTLSPVVNLLAAVGVTDRAPSQVNEEYLIPIMTNVGTFSEPFYRDGGMVYLLIGVVIQTFLVDALARWFLTFATPFCRYAAAVLCFTSAVAFFTPKITTTPVWLFLGLALLERAWDLTSVWRLRLAHHHGST